MSESFVIATGDAVKITYENEVHDAIFEGICTEDHDGPNLAGDAATPKDLIVRRGHNLFAYPLDAVLVEKLERWEAREALRKRHEAEDAEEERRRRREKREAASGKGPFGPTRK